MSLDDFNAALGTGKQQDASLSIASAFDANPEEEGKRLSLQNATGLPVVGEESKRSATLAKYMADADKFFKVSPTTAEFVAEPQNAKVANDDLEALSTFDTKVNELSKWAKDVILPTPARALSSVQAGIGGGEQWIGDTIIQPLLNVFASDEMRQKYGSSNLLSERGKALVADAKTVEKQIQSEHPLDPNSMSAATAGALQSIYMQAPFMLGGALMGTAKASSAFALSGLGLVTAGGTYGERRSQGYGVGSSAASSVWDAAIEVATEKLPMDTLWGMFKPAAKQTLAKLGLSVARLYGSELAGESLATFFQSANARFMSDVNDTPADRVEKIGDYINSGEALQDWYNTLKTTMVQTSLMAGAGAGVNRLRQGSLPAAEEKQRRLIESLQAVEESRLKKRAPESFAEFAQRVGEKNGIPTVYVPAEKVVETLLNNGVAQEDVPAWFERYGATQEAFTTALNTGGNVGLDFGKVATNFATDTALNSLQGEFLVDPTARPMSQTESGVEAEVEHMAKLSELYQQDQADKIDNRDIDAWEEAILNTRGLKGRVTRESLTPLVARANVLHSLTGVPAIEHLNRMLKPAGVRAMKYADYQAQKLQSSDGTTYNQTGEINRDENFKRWFGESKVRQQQTSSKQNFYDMEPLVVYHSTNKNFNVFGVGRETINSTTFGDITTARHGIFFAEDPSFAEGYGTGDGQQVMPVYLSIKNPLYLDEGINWEDLQQIVDNAAGKVRGTDFKGLNADEMWQAFDGEFGKNFVEAAKAAGHDGAYMIESDPETGDSRYVWVAFSPDQIKSVFNRGTFDPNDPNILFQSDIDKRIARDRIVSAIREALANVQKQLDIEPVASGADEQLEVRFEDPRLRAAYELFTAPGYGNQAVLLGASARNLIRGVAAGKATKVEALQAFHVALKELRAEDPDAFNKVMDIADALRGIGVHEIDKKFSPQFVSQLFEAIADELDTLDPQQQVDVTELYQARSETQRYTVKPPKKLYRGVAKGLQDDGSSGTGSAMLGRGLYTTRDRSFAKKYGEVIEVEVSRGWPRNPLVLTNVAGGAPGAFNDWLLLNSGAKNMREFRKIYGDDPAIFVRSKGYDGVVAGDEVVRYPDENGDLLQPGKDDPLASLLTDGGNIISLFEKADKSSFLHETAHIFLNDLKYVAETYGAQVAEWNEVKAWLNVGEDGILTVDQHETFARAFEAYLREGKAPSLGMRDAFRAYKRWMTKIYDMVTSGRFGRLDVKVSPEIADLFDRLLATEQEIEAAREAQAQIAILTDKQLAELGADAKQTAEYHRVTQQAEDSAREKRDKHKLVGREERLKAWREQAETESKAVPIYGMIDRMSRDATGAYGKGPGLDRQGIINQFGEMELPSIPALWRTDGLDVNVAVAENGSDFGYENAAQFVKDLQQMKPRQLWVDQRVAELEVEHDMAQSSMEAIRTVAARRQMEIESEWMAKKAQQKAMSRQVLRAWAEKVVAGRTIKQILAIDRLLAESRQHRQQAIVLGAKGDWAGALKSNEQARMTEELISASYRAANAWKGMEKNWAKISKWSNDHKNVKIGERFRDQINRLLSQYGIKPKEYNAAAPDLHSFVQTLMTDEIDGTGTVLPAWLGVDINHFGKLTWDQLQDLNGALSFLYGHGRDEVKGLKTAKGEYIADVVQDIINRQAGMKDKAKLKSDATAFGAAFKAVQQKSRQYFARTNMLRFIAQRMDGYQNVGGKGTIGPAEQKVQDIIAALAKANDKWGEYAAKIEPLLEVLSQDRNQVFTDLRVPEKMAAEGDSWTKERVVAACLNMGNDSNLTRLMDGYGLTVEDVQAIARKLTVKEWQAVQQVWNTINQLWPEVADVHERLNYIRPKKIEANPLSIQAADGPVDLPGGYYPVSYDRRMARRIAEWGEKDDILASHEAVLQVPVTKSGFTKARTAKTPYALNLSLSVLGQHFNDTIRYITLSEVVRDADRIFRNDALVEQNNKTLGRDMQDMIRPALKNTLRPALKDYGIFEAGRVKMSMFYMAWNAWTAMQNITGLFPAIRQTGAANYANGLAHVMANPLEAHRAMLEVSGYMRLREENIERDLKRQLRTFKVGGMVINGKRYNFKDAQSLGFAGIRFIDTVVSLPAWWGKYQAEMDKHGDAKAAIEAADAAVNKALGSGLSIDTTEFQRHPFFSLLAPFMSFAATQQEVLATEKEAWQQGKLSNSDFLYGQMMTWVMPAVMSTFLQGLAMYGIVAALGGGDDERKKKTLSDYATDLFSYRLMGVPFFRDGYNALVQGIEKKAPPTSARMPITEIFKMMQVLAYKVGSWDGSEKKTKELMWVSAEIASALSGIPATRIYDRWMKGQKQIESGDGWFGNHFIPQENKKK